MRESDIFKVQVDQQQGVSIVSMAFFSIYYDGVLKELNGITRDNSTTL